MIKTRKIVLLSALLISASSITAPTYAMIDDGQGVSAPRIRYAEIPPQLTLDMIPGIRKHKSFLASTKEYVLQNSDQLDKFESYLNPDSHSSSASRTQQAHNSHLLQYIINDGDSTELSRLVFKARDFAFVPGSVVESRTPVSLPGQSPLMDYSDLEELFN